MALRLPALFALSASVRFVTGGAQRSLNSIQELSIRMMSHVFYLFAFVPARAEGTGASLRSRFILIFCKCYSNLEKNGARKGKGEKVKKVFHLAGLFASTLRTLLLHMHVFGSYCISFSMFIHVFLAPFWRFPSIEFNFIRTAMNCSTFPLSLSPTLP